MSSPPLLSGEAPPDSPWMSFIASRLLAILAAPWIALALGLIAAGALAFDPNRKQFRDVWICLPAGLALLSIIVFLFCLILWRYPRLTIFRFRFDGVDVTLATIAHGEIVRRISDLESITVKHGRRGRLQGWWLKFSTGEWMFLSPGVQNAGALIESLQPHARLIED